MGKGSENKIASFFLALSLLRQVIIDCVHSHIATEDNQSAAFYYFGKIDENWHLKQ